MNWRGIVFGALLLLVNYFLFLGLLNYSENGILNIWLVENSKLFEKAKWFIFALIPIILRMALIEIYWPIMKIALSKEERESETHRGMVLTLSGFSFSAFFVLVIAAGTVDKSKIDLESSVLFMLFSFLLFYSAFLLESYKFNRFREELGITLYDTAKLTLLISIGIVLTKCNFQKYVELLAVSCTLGLWVIDFLIRFFLRRRFLDALMRYKQ